MRERPLDLPPLLLLQAWLSPSFPIGAFAYSHAIEAAAEAGDIGDETALAGWIDDLLRVGSGRNDAVLAAAAHRAALAFDSRAAGEINDLAFALCPSAERRLETGALGAAFVAIVRAAWPCVGLDLLPEKGEIAYPIAFGLACGGRQIDLEACLAAYLLAFASNLISAALRCAPIGQTQAQRVLANLGPVIVECARFAAGSEIDDVGGAALRSDIASMRHETQYSRMFRS
ncbi:MAG TPA: urease accessory protein UreF [Beijerinckiaceae bacterium]|nr:urease accessory protein UreF [Beijerinckiaceae bacterium]